MVPVPTTLGGVCVWGGGGGAALRSLHTRWFNRPGMTTAFAIGG